MLIKKMKGRMICRKSECFINRHVAKGSNWHYHCLRCQRYKFQNFFKVVQHSLNACNGPEMADPQSEGELVSSRKSSRQVHSVSEHPTEQNSSQDHSATEHLAEQSPNQDHSVSEHLAEQSFSQDHSATEHPAEQSSSKDHSVSEHPTEQSSSQDHSAM